MNPLTFLSGPDWRSAVLAAFFTLPWLALLARGALKRLWPWAALLAGAVVFPLSIAWVQTPIQQGLSALWLSLLGPQGIQAHLLAVAVPSIAATGLVQESAKLAATGAGLWLAWRAAGAEPLPERRGLLGLALGAAAGAGFGGLEAFWTFNTIFASGWTWGTVQLGGPLALLGFVERFFAVPFHIGIAALAGYGLATGRTWRFLLLAMGLHGVVNYGAFLGQAVFMPRGSVAGLLGVEAWVALVGGASMAVALWLRTRGAQTPTAQVEEA